MPAHILGLNFSKSTWPPLATRIDTSKTSLRAIMANGEDLSWHNLQLNLPCSKADLTQLSLMSTPNFYWHMCLYAWILWCQFTWYRHTVTWFCWLM